jgi:hypothetical protein
MAVMPDLVAARLVPLVGQPGFREYGTSVPLASFLLVVAVRTQQHVRSTKQWTVRADSMTFSHGRRVYDPTADPRKLQQEKSRSAW